MLDERRLVPYHSREWDALVEQGWVTCWITLDGFAVMLFDGKRR